MLFLSSYEIIADEDGCLIFVAEQSVFPLSMHDLPIVMCSIVEDYLMEEAPKGRYDKVDASAPDLDPFNDMSHGEECKSASSARIENTDEGFENQWDGADESPQIESSDLGQEALDFHSTECEGMELESGFGEAFYDAERGDLNYAIVDIRDSLTEHDVERFEVEYLEADLQEAKGLEADRLEAERLEAERLEAERLEDERLEAESLEAELLKVKIIEFPAAANVSGSHQADFDLIDEAFNKQSDSLAIETVPAALDSFEGIVYIIDILS